MQWARAGQANRAKPSAPRPGAPLGSQSRIASATPGPTKRVGRERSTAGVLGARRRVATRAGRGMALLGRLHDWAGAQGRAGDGGGWQPGAGPLRVAFQVTGAMFAVTGVRAQRKRPRNRCAPALRVAASRALPGAAGAASTGLGVRVIDVETASRLGRALRTGPDKGRVGWSQGPSAGQTRWVPARATG